MQTMFLKRKRKHFWILNKYIIILPEIVFILYFVFIVNLHIISDSCANKTAPKLYLNFRDYY